MMNHIQKMGVYARSPQTVCPPRLQFTQTAFNLVKQEIGWDSPSVRALRRAVGAGPWRSLKIPIPHQGSRHAGKLEAVF